MSFASIYQIKTLSLQQNYKYLKNIMDKSIFDSILSGGHLDVNDLSPSEKKRLSQLMEDNGAIKCNGGKHYERFFRKGFAKWELIGIQQIKEKFITDNFSDAEKSNILQSLAEPGYFFTIIGTKYGLKQRLNLLMSDLGMKSYSTTAKRFRDDDWKMYEIRGIESIIEEFLNDSDSNSSSQIPFEDNINNARHIERLQNMKKDNPVLENNIEVNNDIHKSNIPNGKYRFKKEFLGQWMQENKISANMLAKILGVKSVNNIYEWAGLRSDNNETNQSDNRGWLPLRHIISICNHFNLPITSFFEMDDSAKLQNEIDRAQKEESENPFKLAWLQLRIDHLQEINDLKDEARKREDSIRAEYEKKLERIQQLFDSLSMNKI